uniref:MHC class I-like antigen recognition-like domain-containing protein n=1 Tax=Calidris pygmaea TaxID=425635 RepID=A0A8C3J3S9_9CHAR
MQPPHHCLLLLLLYLILLSRTWADLKGKWKPWLIHIFYHALTSTFQNTSCVETEGLGLLEDIELGSIDKHTWTIRFYQPWVRPALPRSDWDTIQNMIRIYLQQFNHLINEGAMEKKVPYPFVAQCMAGCELYPNRTSRAFAYVAYNGQDFLSFNTGNATWVTFRDTNLSRYVQAVLQNYTAFSEMVEVLFNDTCVDDMEVLLHYGKAALERQGETTLILAWAALNPFSAQPGFLPGIAMTQVQDLALGLVELHEASPRPIPVNHSAVGRTEFL